MGLGHEAGGGEEEGKEEEEEGMCGSDVDKNILLLPDEALIAALILSHELNDGACFISERKLISLISLPANPSEYRLSAF